MANFYSRIVSAAERWPDGVVIEVQRQSGDVERHTYRQLRRMAEAVATWLQNSGVPRGARCAVLAANSPRWVASYLGALAAGCVGVPLDTAFKADQVRKLLLDSGASVLFCDAKHLPIAAEATKALDVRIVTLDSEAPSAATRLQSLRTDDSTALGFVSLDSILANRLKDFVSADVPETEVAVILYTSGTTSDPKGVMLTHANLQAEMESVLEIVRVGPDDVILGVLPLFHALAQMANLLLPFAAGTRVVYLETLNTTELMRALAERDVTVFCCVPQFFYLIHERIVREIEAKSGAAGRSLFNAVLRFCTVARKVRWNVGKLLFRRVHNMLGPRMRYLVTGGSRFDPEIARDLYALGFDILQAYGLTETSGGAIVTPPRDNVLGSVGKPLPGVEARILDPEPQPETPPVGEIAIRGGIVMKGYYRRDDATAEVLKDGWLHTGDLGYLDAHGNLFITGRKKDVIVLSNGKNIYPEEIEAHYDKSPFIKEICVMGLESAPGQPFAERLHGVIVPDFEALRARKIVNVGDIIRFDVDTLSSQLPSTKRILSYEIWQNDLPRTTTRKLKRFAIRKEVEQKRHGAEPGNEPERMLSDDDAEWMEQPDVSRALEVARAASKLKKEVHPDDSLELDLGLDSMERVELLVQMEEALNAHVPDTAASEVYTVRELVEAVRAASGKSRSEAAGWDALLNEPPPEVDLRVFESSKTFVAICFFMIGRIIQLIARDLFRLRVSGVEKLPRDGPFILCPNHQSFFDPPVFLSVLPYGVLKRFFSVGTSEIFGAGPLLWLARKTRLFPVDPDRFLVPAMRIGAYGLRKGLVLVLYPEGERSIDGSPKRFKKGAAILSTHLRVPIYPVAMDGFFDAWPRGKGFQKFAPLRITIGDPVLPPETVSDPERQYSEVIGEVRRRIVSMWEQQEAELHGRAKAAVAH
jgi:long-chain acyl-CoA synthetase